MSSRHAQRAASDPRTVSPKVKAAGYTGAGLTAAALIVAAFLQAIPKDALESLGAWAAPVGAATTAAGMLAAAYAKTDPARETNLLLDASGGVYTSPSDPEAERFIQGEYASNIETAPAATDAQARPVAAPVIPADGHAGHDDTPALAAESDAAVEDIYQQLRAQDHSG